MKKTKTNVKWQVVSTRTNAELDYMNAVESYFINNKNESTIEKLQNFPKYVPEKNLISFLSKSELFKKIINILSEKLPIEDPSRALYQGYQII